MKFSELCGKQVINIRTGELLGIVNDLGFDPYNYKIHSIFVTQPRRIVKKILPWFFRCEEIQIPIEEIENIMGDVILVRFS